MGNYVDESDVPDCAKAGEATCDEAQENYTSMCQAYSDGLVEASFKLLAEWIDSNRVLP
jgi:hypothetical protein